MEEAAVAAAGAGEGGGGGEVASTAPRRRKNDSSVEEDKPNPTARRRSKRPRPASDERSGAGVAAGSSVEQSPSASECAPSDEAGDPDGGDQHQPEVPGAAHSGGESPQERAEATGPRTRSASIRLCKVNGVSGRRSTPPSSRPRAETDTDGRCKEAESPGHADSESDGEAETEDPSYEVQQGRRILSEFLLDKHKTLTAPFVQPGESEGGCQPQSQPVWFRKMEEKFDNNQYGGITDFVADFRLMLENCYRYHGVDHWLSRQAQKLEMMLEQKLTLLSRPLREKTTIAVTSKGRYGLEEERGATRRRSTPRSLGGMSTGVTESIMIQALRQEEQQRAREEKRLREQERKEAEEAVQKEIEEWEKNLRGLAEPTRMETLWEIPAIGHFLCLAQQILNLPEIVYFDLERCLLMPKCSSFLAKIMTSLLSPHHRRATLHRKPPLPYKMWEAALKRKVQHWYVVVGQAENPNLQAEKLGLCPQFFHVLGETSPLETKAFHQITFYKRVWLLKGLSDHVYETQKEVQDAVLGQPIHECREVVLGYDSHENAYVHFPQFCGADLRVYKQCPLPPPEFPIPPIKIFRMSQQRSEEARNRLSLESPEKTKCDKKETTNKITHNSKMSTEGIDSSDLEGFYVKVESGSQFLSQSEEEMKISCECKNHRISAVKKENVGSCKENLVKPASPGEVVGYGEPLSPGEIRITENGEFCTDDPELRKGVKPLTEKAIKSCKTLINGSHSENLDVSCLVGKLNNISAKHYLEKIEELEMVKLHVKKKKKKKKKLKDAMNKTSQLRSDIVCPNPLKIWKPGIQKKSLLIKKKTKHKKHKSGKKPDSEKTDEKKKKLISPPLPTTPQFQLVCTSLDELRELIAKIEGELKELENNKKKSEKWFYRRQALKDLHSTLGRLLNELLPWEPKLIKAYQRNRARMKKDFDDFKKQPDDDAFIRDASQNEEMDRELIKDMSLNEAGSSNSDHQEIVKKECSELDDFLQPDVEVPTARVKPLRKECSSKETQKQASKNPKRQIKCNDLECLKESPPCKKTKISTNEAAANLNTLDVTFDSDMGKQKIESKPATLQLSTESPSLSGVDEQLVKSDHSKGDVVNVSRSVMQKGTKPIQALLAKHNGNKVTLTSQISSSVTETNSPEERTSPTTLHPSPVKFCSPPHVSPKGPLQMLYKMPDGSCVPIDLSNSQIKIAVQPVIDPKSGEKIMQQVLILPKNFLSQQQDGKCVEKGSPPKTPRELEKQPLAVSQNTNLGHSPSADDQSLSSVKVQSQVSSLTKDRNTAGTTTVTVSASQSLKVTSSSYNFLASSTMVETEGRPEMPSIMATTVTTSNTGHRQSASIQPATPTKLQSKSTSNTGTTPNFNLQQSKESTEAKQELKTVCIRDSQSILVMTRGGNTGVVKVQTNSDQKSPNAITPRPIFTFLPEVQNFVVSKTQPSSPLTSLVPTQTSISNLGQLPTSSSASSVPLGLNHLAGDKVKLGPNKTVNNSGVVPVRVPLPTILSSVSDSPTVNSTTQNAMNIVSGPVGGLSSGGPVQNKVTLAQAPSLQLSLDATSCKQLFLTSPESNKAGESTFLAGATVPKLLLVPSPSAAPCGTNQVTMAANAQPQKLIFMSPPVTPISSSSNLILTKLAHPQHAPLINATQMTVKNADPCQVVLLPFTSETPIKTNPLPGPFQVTDISKGNPAHLVQNNVPKIPGINVLPNISAKVGDGLSTTRAVLPTTCVTTSAIPSVVVGNRSSSSFKTSTGIKTSVRNVQTLATTAAGVSLPTSTFTTFGSRPTTLIKRNENPSRSNQAMLSARHPVAISTVKAEHLASSMLLASVQPKVSQQSLTPSFSLPISTALPNPITVNSKRVPASPQPMNIAFTPQNSHFSKDSCQTVIRFQNPNAIASQIDSSTASRFASVPAPARPSPPAIGNVLSPAALGHSSAHQTTIPSLTKHSVSTNAVTAAASPMQPMVPVPSSISRASGPLDESCIRQKIVINTSTPLAPGTQIVINNHRFIVPPQGLGSGSHVLLISNTLKQSSPGFHAGTDVTTACRKGMMVPAVSHCSQSSVSPSVPPSERLLQTLCPQSAPQIITAVSKSTQFTTGSTLINVSTARSQPQTIVSNFQAPTTQSAAVLPVDTAFSKLLVSPEGAVLNAINTVGNPIAKVVSPSSLTSVSANSSAAVVFPALKTSEVRDPTRTISASSSL